MGPTLYLGEISHRIKSVVGEESFQKKRYLYKVHCEDQETNALVLNSDWVENHIEPNAKKIGGGNL